MIENINTVKLPVFLNDENAWRQIVPFLIGDEEATLHLYYSLSDKEWEFSSIHYKTTHDYKIDIERDKKTLFQLYENYFFQEFLNNRKSIYDKLNNIMFSKDVEIEQLALIKDYSTLKTVQLKLEDVDLTWEFTFSKSIDNWETQTIEIIMEDDSFGNLTNMFSFEDAITKKIKKHFSLIAT